MFDEIATKTIELFKKIPIGTDIAIELDTRLGDLAIDSLKLVEVVFELEEIYRVEADEEKLTKLETVGDIVVMIESALSGVKTVA